MLFSSFAFPQLAKSTPSPGLWMAALCCVLGTYSTACARPTFIDSNVAHIYRTNAHLGPVYRGWKQTWVGRQTDQPRFIVHKVEIQEDLAGTLVRMSSRKLRRLVGERVCPPKDHSIWKEIQSGQDILVEMATYKRRTTPFATISCRSAVR